MKAVRTPLVLRIVVVGCLLTAAAWAQIVGESPELERVLAQMDAAAKSFKTTEASVVWDQYQKVINETETQKGRIYFRREGGEVQMAADFVEPGKNRGDVESFLVLGFGGGGRDLFKSYVLRFVGSETVNGVKAEKLELIPKSARLRNNIARILLWIDPDKGISVQQQFFEPDGNYRLAKYSDIRINQPLPENAFKLKTTKRTKFVSPQG